MTLDPRAGRRKPFLRVYADQALTVLGTIHALAHDLEDARAAGDSEEAMHVLGPLGEAFRMLGQLDKAVPPLEEALALARELERPKFVIANLIRLATAYQYLNRHAEAEPLFVEALERARERGFMEDFALQHYGKCLAELRRWDEAIACFEHAIARRTGGDPALLDSSREALALAEHSAGRA